MIGKISLGINAILAIAVIYLFTQIGSNKEGLTEVNESSKSTSEAKVQIDPNREYPSIAWVSYDSLYGNYSLMQEVSAELTKIGNDISSLETRFQATGQQRAQVEQQFGLDYQNGVFTTEEEVNAAYLKAGEEAERLEKALQSLENQIKKKYDILSDRTRTLNDSTIKEIDSYIDSFCDGKSIDLILLYSQNQNGLFANDALDLTEEVVTGLNERYNNLKTK